MEAQERKNPAIREAKLRTLLAVAGSVSTWLYNLFPPHPTATRMARRVGNQAYRSNWWIILEPKKIRTRLMTARMTIPTFTDRLSGLIADKACPPRMLPRMAYPTIVAMLRTSGIATPYLLY